MPSVAAFRLSFYGALALACVCLAQASSFFVNWMWLLLLTAWGLLALAYRLEGRWSLTEVAANRVGVVILVVAGAWVLVNLPRSEEELLHVGVPWPAGLLPYLAPLLVVLLLVKLFRPKRISDFWALQTIGLMMVTLGCVLAGDAIFGILLFAYLAFLLWCFAQYHQLREHQRISSRGPQECALFPPRQLASWPLHATSAGNPLAGLVPACSWTCVVAALGGLMFLAAPRQGDGQWVPHRLAISTQGMLRTGLCIDGGIDLHHVGQVEVSDEPAFQVLAFTRDGPKLDLDPNIRWSVDILDYYDHGHWNHFSKALTPVKLTWGLSSMPRALWAHDPLDKSHPRLPPANLDEASCYYCFIVQPMAAGGLVYADTRPVQHLGSRPRINEFPTQSSLFFSLEATDTIFWSVKSRKRTYTYGQVTPMPSQSAATPAQVSPAYVQFLLQQADPPEIVSWTRSLLTDLPNLTDEDRQLDAKGCVMPQRQANVAQALCRYLSQSGEFRYSLELRRSQLIEDPTVDFLLNVKHGHCQRFAGGLAHMLRSVGIPARLVVGYKGLESTGDGAYVVRQSMAHSWVQALVLDDKTNGYQWLTLDPTPALAAEEQAAAWLEWFPEGLGSLKQLWRSLVLEFNGDQQREALQWVGQLFQSSAAFIALVATIALFFGARFMNRCGRWLLGLLAVWRRVSLEHSSQAQSGFYAKLLHVLDSYCRLRPVAGQTPLEFAQAASHSLLGLGVDKAAAELPLPLADMFYQVRYGALALSAQQVLQLEAQIESLRSALTPFPMAPSPAP